MLRNVLRASGFVTLASGALQIGLLLLLLLFCAIQMRTVLFIYLFIYLFIIYLFIYYYYLPFTPHSVLGEEKVMLCKKKVIVRTHRHTHNTTDRSLYLDHTVTDNHPTRYTPVVAGKGYLLAQHDAVSKVRVNGSPV